MTVTRKVTKLHTPAWRSLKTFLHTFDILYDIHSLPLEKCLPSTNLIAPFVNNRHINVINKYSHLLASRRTVCVSHSLVHIAFNRPLEHQWRGRRRKVEALTQMSFRIVFTHVSFDHDCLGCSLFTDQ